MAKTEMSGYQVWLSLAVSKVRVRIGTDLGSTQMMIGFLKQRERKKGIPY